MFFGALFRARVRYPRDNSNLLETRKRGNAETRCKMTYPGVWRWHPSKSSNLAPILPLIKHCPIAMESFVRLFKDERLRRIILGSTSMCNIAFFLHDFASLSLLIQSLYSAVQLSEHKQITCEVTVRCTRPCFMLY